MGVGAQLWIALSGAEIVFVQVIDIVVHFVNVVDVDVFIGDLRIAVGSSIGAADLVGDRSTNPVVTSSASG